MIAEISDNSWGDRDLETGRHNRNGHVIQLEEVDWRCVTCHHVFDAAVDADEFVCGESCNDLHLASTDEGK